MPAGVPAADLLELSIEKRLELVEALWDSIAAEPEKVPVPDWHASELDRRQAIHADDPMSGTPWGEIRQRLLSRTDAS